MNDGKKVDLDYKKLFITITAGVLTALIAGAMLLRWAIVSDINRVVDGVNSSQHRYDESYSDEARKQAMESLKKEEERLNSSK